MYVFMFIITFLISLKTSWTYNNFTYLSYQADLRIYYLIWVTTISIFLLFKVTKLFKHITYLTPLNKLLIGSSFVSMLLGSYLPYHPENENIISVLHVIISSTGTLLLLLIIQLLINRIIINDYDFYKKMTTLFRSYILTIGMLIVMFGSITSIVELFYTFTVLFMLSTIEKHYSKKKM